MIRREVVVALAATLIAVPAWAKPKIAADTTPGTNFGSYSTFAIVNAGAPGGMNPVTFERIRQAVETGLSGKGYSKGAPGDLSVIVTVGARDKTDVQTWGAFGRQVDVRQYTEGSLSIDVFDTKTKQAVWHGQAVDTVSAKKLEPGKVEAVVADVMTRFPAKP